MIAKWSLIVATALAVFGCSEGNSRNELAKAFRKKQLDLIAVVLEKLTQTEQIDLVVLDGGQIIKTFSTKDGDRFHGWKVQRAGRRLDKDESQAFIEVLKRELPSRRGSRADCFEPGFAVEIGLKNGKSVDLVFCFGCGGMLFFDESGIEQEPWLPVIDELQAVFEDIAKLESSAG